MINKDGAHFFNHGCSYRGDYKWGFFGLDWNGIFVLFFQHLVHFLLEKGRKGYTAIQTLGILGKHLEHFVYFEYTWEIRVGIGMVLYTLFFQHLVHFLLEKGRKRYTAIQNTWHTWKTLGTLGILGKHLEHLVYLEHFVYFEYTWEIQVGIFRFGSERYLRTLFPTSRTFLVGKGEEGNTWYTWKTLGILCVLRKHLVYFVYFENTWHTWYTWKTLGTLGILGKHERKACKRESFWIGGGRGYTAIQTLRKARKEQVFGLERHLCTFPMYLVWKGGQALQTCIVQSGGNGQARMERYLSIVGTTET